MKSNQDEIGIITNQIRLLLNRHSQGVFFLVSLFLVGSFFFVVLQPLGVSKGSSDGVTLGVDETMQLKTELETVRAQKSRLEDAYNKLNQKYSGILANPTRVDGSVNPPFTLIAGRQFMFSFKLLSGNLETWTLPIESYERSYFRGEYFRTLAPEMIQNQYAIYNNYVNFCNAMVKSGVNVNCENYLSSTLQDIRKFEKENSIPRINTSSNGINEDFYDYSFFVEPQPFVKVIKQLKDSAPDDYTLITELFNIIKQGPTYVSEIKETPRYPIETLTGSGGDCEDTSILMASLLKAANQNWEVQLWYIDSNNPTSPKTYNHVIVYVDTGTVQTFIETTSKGEMNPYPNGVYGYSVTIA